WRAVSQNLGAASGRRGGMSSNDTVGRAAPPCACPTASATLTTSPRGCVRARPSPGTGGPDGARRMPLRPCVTPSTLALAPLSSGGFRRRVAAVSSSQDSRPLWMVGTILQRFRHAVEGARVLRRPLGRRSYDGRYG